MWNFLYHWFLCLCKPAKIFSHVGFCCFPSLFANMLGKDQTGFCLIVKRRLPWKPRWILQGSLSSSLRSEINLHLGRRNGEPCKWAWEWSREVWLPGQPCRPHRSRAGSPLLFPGDGHPVTTCHYLSNFSATVTSLLSYCSYRQWTQRLPMLAHWQRWLWPWMDSALLPSRGC